MDKDEYKDEKAEKSGNQKRKSLGQAPEPLSLLFYRQAPDSILVYFIQLVYLAPDSVFFF